MNKLKSLIIGLFSMGFRSEKVEGSLRNPKNNSDLNRCISVEGSRFTQVFTIQCLQLLGVGKAHIQAVNQPIAAQSSPVFVYGSNPTAAK